MGAADTVRVALERFIADDPVTLTFVRTIRVDKGGRFEKVTEKHGPYPARLLRPNERSIFNPVTGTPGAFESDILFALFDASFGGKEGMDITEVATQIDDAQQVYTLRSITRLPVFGQLTGYSCILERGRPREV